jgi:hypothetical protein
VIWAPYFGCRQVSTTAFIIPFTQSTYMTAHLLRMLGNSTIPVDSTFPQYGYDSRLHHITRDRIWAIMSTPLSSQATTPSLPQGSSSSISRTTTPNNKGEVSERDRRRAQNRENLRAHYGLQERRDSLGVTIGENKQGGRRQVEGDPLDPGTSSFAIYVGYLVLNRMKPKIRQHSPLRSIISI